MAREIPAAWWMPAAVAVGLATGLSILYFMRAPGAPAGPAITFEKPEVWVSPKHALTFRGSGARSFLSEMTTAVEPYEGGRYAEAFTSLTALRAKYRDVAEPALYQGLSLLLSGDAAAAIEPLEHARDLIDIEEMENVTWYLAAAYERAGRRGDALRFAQAVCNLKASRSEAACAAAARLGPR